ncbi:ATP-binding cassette domain-containing protein, partial [Calditerricola satsumensis]|uniref:ATP-binding cassette domain-containing protein n=1 Tax=Calditerricola satsumensis TaxID=373054 RepID=UPI0012EED908
MTSPFLKVDAISLTLKNEPILKNVSFEAYPGEVVGIVGRNGSGKSMLFKCIAGLIIPQQGEIWVGNFAVVRERRFPPHLGALIENPGLSDPFPRTKTSRSSRRFKERLATQKFWRLCALSEVES